MKTMAALSAMVVLAGCAALPGQRLAVPDIRLPGRFSASADTAAPPTAPANLGWLEEFDDPILSQMVRAALQNSTDIQAAVARVQESRALLDGGRSNAYPRVDLAAGASRTRASLEDPARNPGAARTGSRWSVDATVSWEADLFGRRDAEVSALSSRADAREARADALRLTVTADVLTRTLEVAALNERLKLAEDALALEQDLLAVVRARLQGGQAAEQDALRAQVQVSRSVATLAQLQLQRADTLSALAVLMSATPAQVGERLAAFKLPATKSMNRNLAAPSEMLLTRPDVRVATAELRATSADLAAAAADRYPRFDIAATLGWVAANASGLGSAAALATSLTSGLRWRALDFGELDARVAGREAAERATVADYKGTVMRAFAEAETALLQLQQQRDRASAAESTRNAQQAVCDVERSRYAGGLSDLTPALEACRELNAAVDVQLQAQRDVLVGRVIVHKVLGRSVDDIARR